MTEAVRRCDFEGAQEHMPLVLANGDPPTEAVLAGVKRIGRSSTIPSSLGLRLAPTTYELLATGHLYRARERSTCPALARRDRKTLASQV